MNAETFQLRFGDSRSRVVLRKGLVLSLSPLHGNNTLWLYEDKIIIQTSANTYYWRFLDIANWQIRQMWHRHVKSEYSLSPQLAAAICTGLVMCKLFKAMKDLA